MPRSSSVIKAARFAPIVWLGAGWFLGAGCGPSERGSVKVPAELSRGGQAGGWPWCGESWLATDHRRAVPAHTGPENAAQPPLVLRRNPDLLGAIRNRPLLRPLWFP